MELRELVLLMWRNTRYIILGIVLGAFVGSVATKIQIMHPCVVGIRVLGFCRFILWDSKNGDGIQ